MNIELDSLLPDIKMDGRQREDTEVDRSPPPSSPNLKKIEDNMVTMKQKTLSRRRMTSLLLLTMSVLTGLTCVLAWVLSVPDVRYLILLDAGTVHTSVYTYRFYSTGPGHVEVTEAICFVTWEYQHSKRIWRKQQSGL